MSRSLWDVGRRLVVTLTGTGRAEDLAGIAIVLTIAASSALAAYEAISRLMHPRHVSDLIAVAAAALIGFAGNELVAGYRIRTGRKIGSAALIADGLHARTDGFTSLAVLLGAGGVALGWDWADPVVGLLITVAILAVLRQAAREIIVGSWTPLRIPLSSTRPSRPCGLPPVCSIPGRSGYVGSAIRSGRNAKSSSIRTSPRSRPTRLRSAQNTRSCTPFRAYRRHSSTQIPLPHDGRGSPPGPRLPPAASRPGLRPR